MKRLKEHLQSKRFAKHGKKTLKLVASPFTIGLAVTFAITLIANRYYKERAQISVDKDDHSLIAVLNDLNEKSIDWRLGDRGQAAGSERVAILAIDEKAVQQEGRFPWPRDKQARMVERAVDYGAKSVSFDIAYSEADETSAIPTLRKLKRSLAGKPRDGEAMSLIDSELTEVDGDQAFANMLKKHSDRMILGSFFDAEVRVPSYADFCTDAAFERTAPARYWKHEQLPLTVVDKTLEKINFPAVFKEKLGEYLLIQEVQASNAWFDEHKEMAQKVTERLEELAAAIPAANYPGIATLWINNDVEQAKQLLEAIRPDLASSDGVRRLFTLFSSAFSKQETASLAGAISRSGNEFCRNFFSERDELLNLSAYKKVFGEAPESLEQFKEYSWENVWSKAQEGRQPANNGDGKSEPLGELIDRIRKLSPMSNVANTDNWVVNIPLISDFTKHTGYFNAKVDRDGTVRRSYLIVRRGNTYMPSLALKQFLTDRGYRARVTIDADQKEPIATGYTKSVKSLEILDQEDNVVMNVPIDPHGFLVINYSGAQKMFPHVSAADILTDAPRMKIETREYDASSKRWRVIEKDVDKKEFLKDKLLIAGATATGIYDLRVTPFEENYPGVETHANVLSNLLVENDRALKANRAPASAPGFLRTHPREEKVMWVLLLALGVTLAALLTYYGSIAGLGITAAALGGVYAVDKYYFFNSGIVTTVLFPIAEICGSFVTLTFYKYFTEERKKRELKGTFEKYVSPAIVAEVMADPENIELGGKKMELTVMFSDVRGFTTISEKLDPRQLSDLLNSYLTPMTDLVFKNKGTLDKYMGDAIMAFWGAPIHFPDHAKHAARCALQMIEKLKQLQAEYRAKGLPNIDIGIGLNSGDMSVGNMGSETVRSYTVMGDSVNLGSRLEGINKEYGTRIIVSEFTQKEIADSFVTREVDWVRVKGKAQPVRIFELIAEGKPTSEIATLLERFNAGFQLYHERKFHEAIASFKGALEIHADDAVSQLYIERCEEYLKEPPADNWDGVCTMTHK